MAEPIHLHLVHSPNIALAAQRAQRSLERLRDSLNRLSDAEHLLTNALENEALVQSLLNISRLLDANNDVVHTELNRWGL